MPKFTEPTPPPRVSVEVAVGLMHAALVFAAGRRADGNDLANVGGTEASLLDSLAWIAWKEAGEQTATNARAAEAAALGADALDRLEHCGANPPAEVIAALLVVAEAASESGDPDLVDCAVAALRVAGRRPN